MLARVVADMYPSSAVFIGRSPLAPNGAPRTDLPRSPGRLAERHESCGDLTPHRSRMDAVVRAGCSGTRFEGSAAARMEFLGGLLEDQHRVAVAIEAVTLRSRNRVDAAHLLKADERGDKCDER